MRQRYWNDNQSPHVQVEKQFLLNLLIEQQIFDDANLDDAKYLFFHLPSVIIVKGYALGFQHQHVIQMIEQFISIHFDSLQQRQTFKIQYRI